MGNFDSKVTVSAIVVTHNSVENILPCLESLEREINEIGGEVILYDNASRDATLISVRNRFPNVKIIVSPKNIGFAAANNAAAREAMGKFILLVNPDLIFDKGGLKILIESYEQNESSGAVCPRLRHHDGSFQATCRNLPTPGNIFFSRGSLIHGRKLSQEINHGYTLGDFEETTEVPACAATCLLMEKELFFNLKGFDERFFMFMEDTDLCLRIGQAGRKIFFVPAAGGIHLWGKGSDISKLRRNRYQHISVWKYFLKHYPNGFSLFLLPLALSVNFLAGAITGTRRLSEPGRE